jgi:hypothetical protein
MGVPTATTAPRPVEPNAEAIAVRPAVFSSRQCSRWFRPRSSARSKSRTGSQPAGSYTTAAST